jgi:hypothetical protein
MSSETRRTFCVARLIRWLLAYCVATALVACGGDDCYSPTHPLHAQDKGAVGCGCDPQVDHDVCVVETAFICQDHHWQTGVDGPCAPGPDRISNPPDGGARDAGSSCFSPTQNVEHAYDPSARGCACDSARDQGVCVGRAALVCMDDNRWSAVEDGPCWGQPGQGADGGTEFDGGADSAQHP